MCQDPFIIMEINIINNFPLLSLEMLFSCLEKLFLLIIKTVLVTTMFSNRHNPLYRDIIIDNDETNSLTEDGKVFNDRK